MSDFIFWTAAMIVCPIVIVIYGVYSAVRYLLKATVSVLAWSVFLSFGFMVAVAYSLYLIWEAAYEVIRNRL